MKRKGSSELVTSLLVILSIIILLIVAINSLGSMNIINEMDQVERQALVSIEVSGELSASDIDLIKSEITKIVKRTGIDEGEVFSADGTYGVYLVDKDGNKRPFNSATGYTLGYGEVVYLCIKCRMKTNLLGGINNPYRTYYKIRGTVTKRL